MTREESKKMPDPRGLGDRIRFIGIGCSAGGIEALGNILPQLPIDFPAAIAVVLHISPDSTSLLPEIFRAKCKLPVKEAEDKERILPGSIYFAPPNYHLLVETDGSFSLSVEEPVQFSRPSIDVLLESAAFAFKERALGIVLTGANSDGALGLKQIVDCGGLAIVEDPKIAAQSMMPESALKAVPDALVLNHKEIGDWLGEMKLEKGRAK